MDDPSIARKYSTITIPPLTAVTWNRPTWFPIWTIPSVATRFTRSHPGCDGRIDQVRFEGHGCVISQAATSLLADRVEAPPSKRSAGSLRSMW